MERDDVGVVCGEAARAAAGLPAEKETPPFRRKKRPEPLCYFNSKFMNSPLCVLPSESESRHNQHSNVFKYLRNARMQSDRAVGSGGVKHEPQHLQKRL